MKLKKKVKVILVLFAFLGMLGITASIFATDNSGKIILTKDATKVSEDFDESNQEYGRLANVTLTVSGNPFNGQEEVMDKLDIILVLDGSGSMAFDDDGNYTSDNEKKRITSLKTTATSFIDTMLDDAGNVRIGIVEYGNSVKQSHALSTDKASLKSTITSMSANGGTNLQSGIVKADELLDSARSDAKQIVIILTDGIPTLYNYTYTNDRGNVVTKECGNGNYDLAGGRNCPNDIIPSEAAKTALDNLKTSHNKTDVYSITFGNESEAATKLAGINPATASDANPLYKNVTALNAEDLKKEFQDIQDKTKNIVATNGVVTDVIPKEFELTAESKEALIAIGVKVVEDKVSGTTTLTWNIGNIEAGSDKQKVLSFNVVAKAQYHGSIYTNETSNYESATLIADIPKDNPYPDYTEDSVTLKFEAPTVDIPAITYDDHYSDNASYVGVSESTISGTTILENDLNKILRENKETSSEKIEVIDEIVVDENDDVIKVSDGVYQIKDGDKILGTLTMNLDGTFTFVSEEGVTGEVEFDYHIRTKVTRDGVVSYVYSNSSTVTLNIISREKINISGSKIWDDGNNQDGIRPDSITVVLNADGEKIAEQEVKGDKWSFEFNDLYKYRINHEGDNDYLIDYTVSEKVNVPGYTTKVEGFVITNKHVPEVIDVTGSKVWDDNNNQDGIRPESITVNLYANGEKVDSVSVSSSDKWTYSFTDLPKYESGKEIVYTVNEVKTAGYTTSVEGFVITNKHVPEVIDITGSKSWDDGNNQDGIRPDSITVNLYANGEKVDSVSVTSSDGWEYEFNDLPKYKSGKEIVYTIIEDKVPGYTTSVDKFNIINKHVPEVIEITGSKSWDDGNNQDGIRPDSITVKLYANGSLVKTISVTSSDDWKYEFKDLPKYKSGEEIVYTLSEDKVPGYTTSIDGFDITNKHVPEVIDITGSKTWDDNDDQDGIRPDTITVRLLADGEEAKTKVVLASDDWKYTFSNLPKYKEGKEIVYTLSEDKVTGYTTSIDGFNITNKHVPEVIDITGSKSWDDADNQDGIRPESITVRLLADGKEINTKTVTASNNWKYEFNDLPKYRDGGIKVLYTVSEDKVTGYTTSIDGFVITNKHVPEVIDVTGSKVWDDGNNQDGIRPESITVNLHANGEKIDSVSVSSSDKWTYSFVDLPKYESGEEVVYTVSEDKVPGYTTSVEGFVITNKHVPEVIDVTGSKTWDDNNNQDGIRPSSITVSLYANGSFVKNAVVTSKNDWKYAFKSLPKYEDGKEIVYTVSEDKVPGYTTSIDEFVITNKHVPEVIDVTGSKVWDDNNNQDGIRPESITVRLFAGLDEVDSVRVTSDNNWKYEFKDLPKYKEGKEIVYTVSEDKVTDYTTSIDGFVITNKHNPEVIDITGSKTWDDADNQDGVRPDFITVNLYANGKEIDSTTVSSDNKWTYSFTDLPKYESGEEIVYTITEDEVSGYKAIINNFNIINKHIPEVIDITGSKTWDDNNNQDGKRPDFITVNLYADGKLVDTKDVTSNDNWKYTFNNLPKYRDAGEEIVYTVSEDEVTGYTSSVNGFDITNKHNPEVIDITGSKTWDDADNQDGIRPESITVRLFADGEEVSSKVVTSSDNWKYTFSNLPKYKAGEEIVYTVSEDEVNGYTSSINGFDITNKHNPEVIDITGSKTWDDADNQDGMRPESITVNLLANGKEVSSKVVTSSDNWKYTFENVPKYDAGEEIVYTVSEDEVSNYEGIVNGVNITNKHVPITISINGEKVWVDEDDIEGLRPDYVTIRLLADGEEVSSKVVSSNDNWKYTFNDLPKYKEGKEINYTVTEDEVSHYEMSIDKDNKFVIINTHDPKDVTISGTKTWVDSENRYGRPESITVTLSGKIGDKEVVSKSLDVTASDNWSYTFSDLPEYREGMLIVYTIDEEDVKDYDKAINGYDIINTYNPETVDITGTKTWDDNNNQDGIRPESIMINLLANGEVVDTTYATDESNWTFEFKDQVVYANGVKITYTIEEVLVDGYTTLIEDFDIVNHHTPEVVSYTVSKVWNDQNNNDRIRPESITVRLLADGVEIMSQIISEEDNWTYSFTDLPKYRDAGTLIIYEIVEDEVKGYVTTIENSVTENDLNNTNVIITNTHENEKNKITINKVWNDSNDKEKVRPNSIFVTVTGTVDGKVIVSERVEITKDLDWTYTIENFDKYLDGEEIIYEIFEDSVKGYSTIYDGYTITNVLEEKDEILPPQTGVSLDNLSMNSININDKDVSNSNGLVAIILVIATSVGITRFVRFRYE